MALRLNGNSIGDEGATRLAEMLSRNDVLRTLEVCSNDIMGAGATALAEALGGPAGKATGSAAPSGMGQRDSVLRNRTLCRLYIGGNRIGVEGAAALGSALRRNDTLEHLHLRFDDIGAQGAGHLARALQSNTTLTDLHVASATWAADAPTLRALHDRFLGPNGK
jgi:Ran GTPase-activating protein (RanGAP) involved in mRNA processing and transport